MIARSMSASPNDAMRPLRPACAQAAWCAASTDGGEAEGGISSGREHVLAREGERAAKLVEIILVGQSRRLVEPLRHQQLGRNPFSLATIGELDARPHEGLRRFGERHHAETKRQPQLDRPLVEARLHEAQTGLAHALLASIRPRR